MIDIISLHYKKRESNLKNPIATKISINKEKKIEVEAYAQGFIKV